MTTTKTENSIIARYHDNAGLSLEFDQPGWRAAPLHEISTLWSGQPAPAELKTTARVVWNGEVICFGYECSYTELDIDEEYDAGEERYALWERDVCEAFVRSPVEPDERVYKEFEVAPTGQWIDLHIDRRVMLADWQWGSGMRTAAEIDMKVRIWRACMEIPFTAFGCKPKAGDAWMANLFRCTRFEGERQYLAYSPTFTEKPNFHIPERFLKLRFLGD